MPVATLTIHLHLPGCASLKEKRGRIKPILARLHREFNISAAELGLQDKWTESLIGCAMIGADADFLVSALETVQRWLQANWSDGDLWDTRIELL